MSEKAFLHSVRQLFATADGVDPEKYVMARYRITPGQAEDIRATSAKLALVASIGTVTPLPLESPEDRIRYGPRIIHLSRGSTGSNSEILVAFPVSLFTGRDPITQLMSVTMFGAEYNYASDIRLEWIDLPRQLQSSIDGPMFGQEGVRNALGVYDRPILAAILKPRIGTPLHDVVSAAEAALIGGLDCLMDDELVVDPVGDFHFRARVKALVIAAERASATTGSKKTAIVNISARPSHAIQYAEQAVSEGAGGLIFNAYICGMSSLQDVVERRLGVPVFACNVGSGLLTRSATGVDSAVYCRLSRLGGADAVQTGIVAGDAYTTEAWGPSVMALDGQLGNIKASMPIVAGGLNLSNLWRNWRSLGNDVLFAAGSGVFGYPGGPGLAGSALRRLLDALSPEMSAKEAAAEIVKLAQRRSTGVAAGLEAYGFDPSALAEIDE